MNQGSAIMVSKRRFAIVAGVIATLVAFGSIAGASDPQKADKTVPKQEKQITLGQNDVKQLLLLLDADKNGKISKKEFMDFMAAEFDRLDKDKSGELDANELAQSQLRASRPNVGK
jgi:hypothetical protein